MRNQPDTERASGRTSFMLLAAIMAHDRGKAVYVISSSPTLLAAEMRRIMARLGRESEEVPSIKFESHLENFDWESGRLKGANKNCEVFIDHYYIQNRFAWMFREVHRWDKEQA